MLINIFDDYQTARNACVAYQRCGKRHQGLPCVWDYQCESLTQTAHLGMRVLPHYAGQGHKRCYQYQTHGFGSTEVSLSVVPIKGRDVDSPLPRTLRFRHAESCKTGSASRLVEAESHSISTVGVRQETICALDTMLNYQA